MPLSSIARFRLATPVLAGVLAGVAGGGPPGVLAQQVGEPEGEPLAGFERLIGTWAAGTSTQTFEWGVGRLVVRARSTVSEAGAARLVSEGLFLYDPLRNEVRGYFAAIEMPTSYFEYSARWQGDTLVADLTTTDPDGNPLRYLERWELAGEDRFRWTLRVGGDEQAPVVMSAEFRRVAVPAAEEPSAVTNDPPEVDPPDADPPDAGHEDRGGQDPSERGAGAPGSGHP